MKESHQPPTCSTKLNFRQLFFFFLIPFLSFSQHEHDIWYFGSNAGISFAGGTPVALTDGALDTWESCATLSSPNGELMFYTDGMTIWNKNHLPMPNGVWLNGNLSTTQTLIVPLPENPEKYYVISIETGALMVSNGGAYYSEVDMTLDGGLGDVTSIKNIPFEDTSTECVTAVQHSNGIDYWILLHRRNSGIFLSFLLTSSGLSSTPIESDVGIMLADNSSGSYTGCMKASSDGETIAAAHGYEGTELLNFDRNTGEFEHILTIPNVHYGIEFSPSGRFLYATRELSHNIHQYDLEAGTPTDIINSEVELGDNSDWIGNHVCALQIAPDGKIYVAKKAGTHLNVINAPEEAGINCNYVEEAFYLEGQLSDWGLPSAIPVNTSPTPPVEPPVTPPINPPTPAPAPILPTILVMPNIITPNGDLANDIFLPTEIQSLESVNGVILNRWGQKVFEGNLIKDGWNGNNLLGIPCTEGVYFWKIIAVDPSGKELEYHGNVTLVR